MEEINNKKEEMSPAAAAIVLWNEGILHWMLHSGQKSLYDSYINCKEKTIVWNCSRRLGKSYTLCVIAIETCLKNPDSLVKYCCSKQVDARSIIRPLIREIITSCPKELRPIFKVQERAWVFPNGSRIELTGLDGGRAESIRGGSCSLGIIDEAGFVNDLKYIVTSILLPTTLTTKGKIILASTPPKSSAHQFVDYINVARIQNNLVTKTIYDNPLIDKEELQKIIDDSGGVHSNTFKREYLCVDEDTLIKTKDGYKKIKNIEVGEKVFTHMGLYQKVKHKFKHELNESNIYEVKCSNNLGFMLTEGHELLVTKTDYRRKIKYSSTSWTKVEDISFRPSERVYFKIPIDKQKNYYNDIDKAYVAGWYVAEGNCSKKNQAVVFSLAHKDPVEDINNAIKKIFKKSLVSYPCSTKENHAQWYLLSKEAKLYFSQFGTHSTKKRVIDEIKYGSDEVKSTFLKAYFHGDGHHYKEQGILSVVSVCKELLCDISDMLLSLGVGCQIQLQSIEKDNIILGRHIHQHESYTLNIGGSNLQKFLGLTITSYCSSFVEDGYFYSKIKSIKPILGYSKQYVYDLEVENDHSYVGLHTTFHNCHVELDQESAVIPEFTPELKANIVKEWERAPFYDAYVAMDLGLKDLTVVLFSWWDFKNSKLIIEDEFVINGQRFNTQALANGIKKKEEEHFTDKVTGEQKVPYLRISDNNLIVINDLWTLHGLRFIATRKDDADAALNNMRLMLQNEKIIINPRCRTLITHLESAVWNKQKTSFDRSADMGHFDAVDSLKYLVRNIQQTKNPFPSGYFTQYNENHFTKEKQNSYPQYQQFAAITNLKSSHQTASKFSWLRKR